MSGRISRQILRNSAILAVAAAGLALVGAAQAQPYNGGYYGNSYANPYGNPEASAPEIGPYANGIVVTAPPRQERTFNGGVVQTVTASRVVNISDLNLNTGWGVHEMHVRIRRAAHAACNQLDNEWTQGLYPMQGNNADCVQRAVDEAMAQAPVGVDAAYTGY